MILNTDMVISTREEFTVFRNLRIPVKVALHAAILLAVSLAPAMWVSAASPQDNSSIPDSALMQPEELVKLLQQPAKRKPRVIFVGFRPLYLQAHIPGSDYVGPASREEALQQLKKLLQSVPRKKLIVLYCGCCPWSHCPNILPAYQAAHAMGFTQLKVLHIPRDFSRDWIAQGYPVQTGE